MHSPYRKLSYLVLLTFVLLTVGRTSNAQVPNPILYLTHTEYVTINGKDFARYYYDVANKESFPASLFAAAPALPPCGANTNASRTWVDFYDMRGKRLNGFCALGSSRDLSNLWFAIDVDVVPRAGFILN